MSVAMRERILSELGAIDAGDARLQDRAQKIGERLLEKPGSGFPQAMSNSAELEGLYRFINNDALDLQTVLAPHRASTHALASSGTTLVIHDTTACYFSEDVYGMGYIGTHSGFLVHTALAVSSSERHAPLGLMGMMPLVRPKKQLSKKKRTLKGTLESRRWAALIDRVEEDAHPSAQLIHVLDREGDFYSLLEHLKAHRRRFVVRAGFDRRVVGEDGEQLGTIWSQVDSFKTVAHRDVEVCARDNTTNARKRRVHPSRARRTAKLTIRSGTLRLRRPVTATCPQHIAETIEVAFVHAVEDNPPGNEAPIEWLLMTSEPIRTAQQALRVIDHYRGRWRIEEFFKALKTGCAFEQRQSESLEALLVVLGLLAPIAWQMLALRSLTHDEPNTPADAVLRATQIGSLIHLKRLKPNATAKDALWAIASLGGHIKNNGPPGWLTLGRGFEDLEMFEAGWIAGRAGM